MEMIEAIPDLEYKDAHPLDTVKRIKDILKSHDIETEESWNDSDVPYCFSVRVSVAGNSFGVNGKGINKAFALASGYGELMERLQLGHIWRDRLDPKQSLSSAQAQSQLRDADGLFARNPQWYEAHARALEQYTGISCSGREIIRQYEDENGAVSATPFYCLTTHTWEHLPAGLCSDLYYTNGGAAGNTTEEAIVQALSELVERHHKIRILSENIKIPDIPETLLRDCTIAYNIITSLRDRGFRVLVKDCSLGTDFPVVCVCIIDCNTGRYHTHFGAHPNFEIALQRTLTESFQGRNIRNIAKHEDFLLRAGGAFDLQHLMNELVKGTAEKNPEFFCPVQCDDYRRPAGLSGKSNQELLRSCVDFFRQQGYDILVRDSSSLGFPTYQIVIPGYSENFPQRLSVKHNDARYIPNAVTTLRDPSTAKMEDLMGCMMHIVQINKQNLSGMSGFSMEAGLPAKLSGEEDTYLLNVALAHVSYTLGRVKETIAHIDRILRAKYARDEEYLLCVKRYLTLQQNRYDNDRIEAVLACFHKPETIRKLYDCLDRKANPLDPVTVHCDMQCGTDCRLYGCCLKKRADRIAQLVCRKAKQLDQSQLENRLKDI